MEAAGVKKNLCLDKDKPTHRKRKRKTNPYFSNPHKLVINLRKEKVLKG